MSDETSKLADKQRRGLPDSDLTPIREASAGRLRSVAASVLSSAALLAAMACGTADENGITNVVPVPVSWTSRRPNHAAFRVSS